MQYICIKKMYKGFLNMWGENVGDYITVDRYNNLSQEEKTHFNVDYSDESIADQIERNIENDKN